MKLNYGRLIDDHARIQDIADRLLSEVRRPNSTATDLAHQLNALQFVVDEHLEVEHVIVGACSELRMAKSWQELMRQGEADFARLRADWGSFLSEWNEELIEADREGFRSAAEAILPRLHERVDAETRALYATGLQMGVITLRG